MKSVFALLTAAACGTAVAAIAVSLFAPVSPTASASISAPDSQADSYYHARVYQPPQRGSRTESTNSTRA
ncbi:MAG: hypothetical protein AAF728_12990 [Cyanobacteria bacterium P01_D01_bin.128]